MTAEDAPPCPRPCVWSEPLIGQARSLDPACCTAPEIFREKKRRIHLRT